MDKQKSKVVLYINFHAYGQLWMTPYGYSTDTPSNEKEMVSAISLLSFSGGWEPM